MSKRMISICVLLITFAIGANAATIFPGLMGKQLIDSVRLYYRPSHTIAYAGTPDARDTLFGVIDKTAQDSVTCVYSTFTIYMQPGQDPDDWAYSHDINAEHTWPQSYLNTSQSPNPTGDLNHLFSCDIEVNSSRGNWPFAEIPDAQTETWFYNNTTGSSIPSSDIDLYGEYGSNTFEPREQQKGATARAMYYMLTMYQLPDTTLSWWTGQRDTLYQWHCTHPATAAESLRTTRVAVYQSGRVNPFIMDSTLIRRCYFPSLPTNTVVNFATTAATRNESAGSCTLRVGIASPSASNATTVQIVLAGGTGTAADVNNFTTQTLTFPAGSSAQQSAIVTITDDALVEGTETVVFKLRNATGGSSAAVGSDSAFTLTITDNDDVTPPVITSGPAVSGITSSTATVTWGTDELSNSWVYYGLTTSYSDTARNEADVTSHSVELSGLAASTTYHYKVSSIDPMNNGPTYSGDNTFATAAAGGFTVVINEVNEQRSSLPLYTNEYVELYNNTGAPVGLAGWTLRQFNSTLTTTFTAADTLPAGGYFVIVRTSTGSWSNFYSIPYDLVGSLTLNGAETFSLHDGGGTLVDSTITFGSSYWCQYRTRPLADGTLPASWAVDTGASASGTYGTPGGTNPLGVELAAFTCGYSGGAVRLAWHTESETDSYLWTVHRAAADTGPYREIGRLDAAGNSSAPRFYAWTDADVQPGHTYYYRIAELDLSGEITHYGPVSVTVPDGPARVLTASAYPNPFRTRTTISYELAAPGRVSLRIYNAAGQLVRMIGDAPGERGVNHARWDGRNDAGRELANGVYLCRLTTADGSIRRKLLIVR